MMVSYHDKESASLGNFFKTVQAGSKKNLTIPEVVKAPGQVEQAISQNQTVSPELGAYNTPSHEAKPQLRFDEQPQGNLTPSLDVVVAPPVHATNEPEAAEIETMLPIEASFEDDFESNPKEQTVSVAPSPPKQVTPTVSEPAAAEEQANGTYRYVASWEKSAQQSEADSLNVDNSSVVNGDNISSKLRGLFEETMAQEALRKKEHWPESVKPDAMNGFNAALHAGNAPPPVAAQAAPIPVPAAPVVKSEIIMTPAPQAVAPKSGGMFADRLRMKVTEGMKATPLTHPDGHPQNNGTGQNQ